MRGYNDLPIIGAIFTEEPYTNISQVKKSLSFADRFGKLFTSDYLIAHSFLIACSASNAASVTKKFESAVDMLNRGALAVEIYKTLHSVKRFQEFLPIEAPKAIFAVPITVLGK